MWIYKNRQYLIGSSDNGNFIEFAYDSRFLCLVPVEATQTLRKPIRITISTSKTCNLHISSCLLNWLGQDGTLKFVQFSLGHKCHVYVLVN